MKFILLSFLFIFLTSISALDIKTEKRLKDIERRIDAIEKRLELKDTSSDVESETENVYETKEKDLLIKEDILKVKISSIRNISGKKKKGLLIEVLIYNPGKYTIKIFTGDLFFYSPSGDIIFTYRAFDDKNIYPGKKIFFPVLVPIEKAEAYFYFTKYKKARVTLSNQRLVVEPL